MMRVRIEECYVRHLGLGGPVQVLSHTTQTRDVI